MIDLGLVSFLPIKWQRSKCACLALTRTQEFLSKISYMAKCSSNKRNLAARLVSVFIPVYLFYFIFFSLLLSLDFFV